MKSQVNLQSDMLRNDLALVSCICITSNTIDLLKRSINCFLHQTYSHKELVIAYTSDNTVTATFVNAVADDRIIALEIRAADNLTLGEKRNLAIEKSSGFYFCVWDDDDWYSNSRIEIQVESLRTTKFRSCVLRRVLVYDTLHDEAYLSNIRWAWEQTLLCEKDILEHPDLRYANLNAGEDSILVFNLHERDMLLSVLNSGLYLYVYHGKNASGRMHWEENIFSYGDRFSSIESAKIKGVLNNAYSNEEASLLLANIFKK